MSPGSSRPGATRAARDWSTRWRWAAFADGHTETWGRPYALSELYERNFIHLSTALFARSLVVDGCRFDEAFEIMQDWDFFLQCAQHTPFHFEPRQTFEWRVDLRHVGNRRRRQQGRGALRALPRRDLRQVGRTGAKRAGGAGQAAGRGRDRQARAHARLRRRGSAVAARRWRRVPDDPWALNALALVYRSTGRLADAELRAGACGRRAAEQPVALVQPRRNPSRARRSCAAHANACSARSSSRRTSPPRGRCWRHWTRRADDGGRRGCARGRLDALPRVNYNRRLPNDDAPAPLTRRNAFYAQSGGVTAVINASACGVIETARQHKRSIGRVYAGRNGIIGALTEDLIDTSRESSRAIAALMHTPAGAFGSCRYKLDGHRPGPRAVRAADRRVSRARHRLFLLQRRQRLGRHLPQGVADGGAARLSADRRPRAEDRRQRSRGHRQLPRLRLGRQVRRDVDARGRVRRRVDGEDVDPGVRARGDGPQRRLDHRGGRAGRRRGHADPAAAAVSRDRVRRSEIPGAPSTRRSRSSAIAASASRKACATARGS